MDEASGTFAADGAAGTAQRLRAVIKEVSGRFFERDEVVRTLVVTLLAGQHSLLLGPPGSAKSELARELAGRIEDSRYWEILLSKFTPPTKIFGPVDVGALALGEYRQVFDGRATTADVGFVDEIFKCSTAALNEMLAYLNERLYHPESGGAPIPCPLIGAITASNELPSGEDSAAIYDRLLVRLEVDYLTDPANFAALIRSATAASAPTVRTTVTLKELKAAVATAVPAVLVPEVIVDTIGALRAALRREGLIASDRRWRQSVRLMQASAWLDGRTEVGEHDVAVLIHVLWDSPTERRLVERQVLDLIDPEGKEALDLEEALDDLEAQWAAKDGQAAEDVSNWVITEARRKLNRTGKDLEKLREAAVAAGRSTTVVDRVLGRQQSLLHRIVSEVLGVSVGTGK
ncbi:AAA family ATPase [Kitasatospora sp. NPDC001261]|uniref:AAA family ATPase n=1 Tax=Kitasatospora sp. NPDC001261 TaxID=3364012 RepID=UPI0036B75707